MWTEKNMACNQGNEGQFFQKDIYDQVNSLINLFRSLSLVKNIVKDPSNSHILNNNSQPKYFPKRQYKIWNKWQNVQLSEKRHDKFVESAIHMAFSQICPATLTNLFPHTFTAHLFSS